MKSKIIYLVLALLGAGLVGQAYFNSVEMNSTSFMKRKMVSFDKKFNNVLPEVKAEDLAKQEQDKKEEPKAVAKKQGPTVLDVPYSMDNAQMIGGKWRIFHQDKNKNLEFLNAIVNFSLTQDSEVTVDRDVKFKVAAWNGRHLTIFREEKGKVQILEALKIGKDGQALKAPKSNLVAANNLKSYETLMALKEFQGGPHQYRPEDISAEMILAPNEIVDLQISIKGNNTISLGHVSLGSGGAFGVNNGGQELISGIFYNRNTLRFTTGPLAGAAFIFAPQSRLPSSEEEEMEEQRVEAIDLAAVNPEDAIQNMNIVPVMPLQTYPAQQLVPGMVQPQMVNVQNLNEVNEQAQIDPAVLQENMLAALNEREMAAADDANLI